MLLSLKKIIQLESNHNPPSCEVCRKSKSEINPTNLPSNSNISKTVGVNIVFTKRFLKSIW